MPGSGRGQVGKPSQTSSELVCVVLNGSSDSPDPLASVPQQGLAVLRGQHREEPHAVYIDTSNLQQLEGLLGFVLMGKCSQVQAVQQ